MSSSEADEVCASCGTVAIDNIKLKKCACNLVKYCSVDCQKNNRPQHKRACKKRLAEIRDDRLFTQPAESYLGECPICCLPLPLDENKWGLYSCCSKTMCNGCCYANQTRELIGSLEQRCAFCREPVPTTDEEAEKMSTERVKANDPVAMTQMGKKRRDEGDYEGAVEYFTKAAALGNIDAHFELSGAYCYGRGVEKDKKKEIYHSEEAAIGGHPKARNNLGCYENENGRRERAVKHFILAAKLGHDGSLETLKKGFMIGLVNKEDYAAALRGHQAAVDATKSKQREEAYAFYQWKLNRGRGD